MAVQNPFFGKRETETFSNRTTTTGNGLGVGSNTNGYGSASSTSAASGSTGSPAVRTSSSASAAESGGSKLTVGPNIKLKGVEITDCDTLVVEGTVEATMDSRVIHIAEQGAFRGSAEIDIAEIHGEFDGQLTVREKLVIFSTGKVSGTIRYGKIVIEEGGQLSGDIQVGKASATPALAAPAAASSVTASTASSSTASGLRLAEDPSSSSSLTA